MLATMDQTLLHGRNALLLLDLFLDLRDLRWFRSAFCVLSHTQLSPPRDRTPMATALSFAFRPRFVAHLVFGFDVKLDLLAGKCSDPGDAATVSKTLDFQAPIKLPGGGQRAVTHLINMMTAIARVVL